MPDAVMHEDDSAVVYALAISLAKPVARGLLAESQANAALLMCAIHGAREGMISRDPIDVASVAAFVMRAHADRIEAERLTTTGRIRRTVRPMIGLRSPSNHIRATGHDVNGGQQFPLSEAETEEIVATEIWNALHVQRREGRAGGQ